jgi:hypothetical protein
LKANTLIEECVVAFERYGLLYGGADLAVVVAEALSEVRME